MNGTSLWLFNTWTLATVSFLQVTRWTWDQVPLQVSGGKTKDRRIITVILEVKKAREKVTGRWRGRKIIESYCYLRIIVHNNIERGIIQHGWLILISPFSSNFLRMFFSWVFSLYILLYGNTDKKSWNIRIENNEASSKIW